MRYRIIYTFIIIICISLIGCGKKETPAPEQESQGIQTIVETPASTQSTFTIVDTTPGPSAVIEETFSTATTTIKGVVIDFQEKALQGAELSLFRLCDLYPYWNEKIARAYNLKPAQTVTTGESGDYVFSDVPVGEYTIMLKKHNTALPLFWKYIISVRSDYPVLDYIIRLDVEQDYKGVILDEASGQVERALIQFGGTSDYWHFFATAETNSEGKFVFSSIPYSEDISLVVTHKEKGYSSGAGKEITAGYSESGTTLRLLKQTPQYCIVRDSSGAPIDDAVVEQRIIPKYEDTGTKEKLTLKEFVITQGITNNKGEYQLMPAPEKKVTLYVRKDGFAEFTDSITNISQGDAHSYIIILNMARPVLKIAVRDSSGTPLPQTVAHPMIHWIAMKPITADEKGILEFKNLPKEKSTIKIYSQGYIPKTIYQISADVSDQEAIMNRGGSITGIVKDKATGNPIRLAVLNGWNCSDKNGKFQMHFMQREKKNLDVYYKGYAPTQLKQLDLEQNATIKDLTIYLSKGATVSGIVYRQSDSLPLKNARVTLDDFTEIKATTDDAGKYTLENVPIEQVTITARADGYISSSRKVNLSDGKNQTNTHLYLVEGGYVEGIVVDEKQQPVAEATVGIQQGRFNMQSDRLQNNTFTQSDGTFIIKEIKPGEEFRVNARHPEYAESKTPVMILTAGERKQGVKLVLLEGGTISGIVLDESRNPMEGAVVKIGGDVKAPMNMEIAKIGMTMEAQRQEISKQDGTFRFEHLSPSNYSMIGMKDGYTYDFKDNLTLANDQEIKGIELVLVPEAPFKGKVLNESREPVEGARITAFKMDFRSPSLGGAHTRENGEFSISGLRAGAHMVTINKDGYPDFMDRNVAVPNEVAEFILKQGGAIKGKVTDKDNGNAVESFTVSATFVQSSIIPFGSSMQGYERPNRKSVTDPEGEYTISGLKGGKYNLTVHAGGYAPKTLTGIKVQENKTTLVNIELDEGESIKGKVVTAGEKEPVAGARVELTIEKSKLPEVFQEFFSQTEYSSFTDESGSFSFDRLPPQSVYITVTADGFQKEERTYEIKSDTENTIEIEMRVGGSVKGIVVDAVTEQPLPGCKIYVDKGDFMAQFMPEFFGEGVTADQQGQFLISHIPAGTYTFKFICEGYSTVLKDKVMIREDETTDLGTIALSGGGGIYGLVLDTNTEPVSGATIFATGPQGIKFASTDTSGEYSISGLGAGSYTIIMSPKSDFSMSDLTGAFQQKTISLKEDERLEVNFFIEPGYTISGIVLDGEEPAQKVVVSYQASDIDGVERGSGISPLDEQGQFSFTEIKPGTYILSVIEESALQGTMGIPLETQTVTVTNSDVSVELRIPHAQISGIITDANTEEPISGAEVVFIPADSPLSLEEIARSGSPAYKSAVSDSTGLYHLTRLKEGQGTLLARHEQYSYATRTVTLQTDTILSDVNFELQSGITLKGKALVLKTGNPVQNLYFDIKEASGVPVITQEISVDSLGNYSVSSLGEGSYRMDAFAQNVAPLYGLNLQISKEQPNVLDLWFKEGGTLSIQVVDGSGEAVDHARIDLLDSTGAPLNYPLTFTMLMDFNKIFYTNSEGHLVRPNIPEGAYTIKVKAVNFTETTIPVTITEEKTTEKTITLE